MPLKQVLREMKRLQPEEIRSDEADYFECVIAATQVAGAHEVLNRFFGPPFKRPDEALEGPVAEFMNRYGGVRANQTLYFIKDESHIYYAMFWPWNDGEMVTIKIEKVKASTKNRTPQS